MKLEKDQKLKKIEIGISNDKLRVEFDGFGYDAIDIDDLLECVDTLIADVLYIVR